MSRLRARGSQKLIGKETNSEANLRLISSWINNCVQHHDSCSPALTKKSVSAASGPEDSSKIGDTINKIASVFSSATEMDPFFPSRIIDIGPCEGTYEPRLCHKNDVVSPKGKYVALSHCWGPPSGPPIPRTTTETLVSRLTGIPMSTLPRTFQDAVFMTRRLGLQYLWIDSLCILQDSEEDWAKESAMMGQVYSNAFCTLAASAAANATEGLFTKRDSRKTTPCILSWASESGVSDGVVIHPFLPYWETALSSDPLGSRAWTLQEQDLSIRIIHFSKLQLHWECRETASSEHDIDTPWRARPNLLHLMGRSRFFDDWAIRWSDEPPKTAKELCPAWYQLIRAYSRRQLTYAKDKLPAISGLAQKVRDLTSDKYVVGLWASDLPRGLLWFGSSESSGLDRVEPYRAPSWSWASVDGPIEWPVIEDSETTGRGQPKVVYTRLRFPGRDNTGQITDGFIVLEGVVQEVWNREAPHLLGSVVYVRHRMHHMDLYHELGGNHIGTVLLDDWRDGSVNSFLMLRMFEEKPERGAQKSQVRALALAGSGRKPGEMKRIGTVVIFAEFQDWMNQGEVMPVMIA